MLVLVYARVCKWQAGIEMLVFVKENKKEVFSIAIILALDSVVKEQNRMISQYFPLVRVVF